MCVYTYVCIHTYVHIQVNIRRYNIAESQMPEHFSKSTDTTQRGKVNFHIAPLQFYNTSLWHAAHTHANIGTRHANKFDTCHPCTRRADSSCWLRKKTCGPQGKQGVEKQTDLTSGTSNIESEINQSVMAIMRSRMFNQKRNKRVYRTPSEAIIQNHEFSGR